MPVRLMANPAGLDMSQALASVVWRALRGQTRRSLWTCSVSLACTPMMLSPAHGQVENEAVLDSWAAHTGEQVEVDRSEDGAVTWSVSASVDIYQREVESPGEADLLTPRRDGSFHNATVSAEWRATQDGDHGSHFYVANTHSSDRAVQSLYRNRLTSLQAGVSRPGRRAVVGDVVANFSVLGAGTGLRGTALQWEAGRHTLEAFGGVVSDSWETLLGTRRLTDAIDAPVGKRHVYGMKFSTPIGERATVFATVQAFDDRAADALDGTYADGRPQPVSNARTSTLGVAYQRRFGGGRMFGLEVEHGASQADAFVSGDRRSDRAFSLSLRGDVPWSGGRYTLGLGHHDLGMDWAGIGAAALAGSRESYLSNSIQWDKGLSWRHDWLDGLTRQPWGDDTYRVMQGTSTHQLVWQPEWLKGGSLALHDIRSRTRDNAGANSRAQQTQASVSLVHGDWQGLVQWGLSGEDFYSTSGERVRLRDWQVAVGHSARDLSRNFLQLASYAVNVSAGRKAHTTGVDNRLLVRSAGVDLSSFSPVWGSLSLSHARQWVRLAVGGSEVPTRSTTLSYSKDLRSGLSLRVYASHLAQNVGLTYAQLREKAVGIQLSQAWP